MGEGGQRERVREGGRDRQQVTSPPDCGGVFVGSSLLAICFRVQRSGVKEREILIDNLLVRIHFVIVMIRWTGLAPYEFEFSFPGSLTSTFLQSQTPNPKPEDQEYGAGGVTQGPKINCVRQVDF